MVPSIRAFALASVIRRNPSLAIGSLILALLMLVSTIGPLVFRADPLAVDLSRVLAAILGPGLTDLIIALTAMGWTGYARMVRGEVLSLRERDYIEAARVLGATPRRLLLRHLVPGLAGPLVVQATFGVGGIVIAEAALSFLGLGARPPTPSWGNMIDAGRAFILVAPLLTTAPGVAIGLSVLGFNLLGDGLAQLISHRR